MTDPLDTMRGKRETAVSCDGKSSMMATCPACVCVSMWMLQRVLSVETDLDVIRVANKREDGRNVGVGGVEKGIHLTEG